MDETWKSNPKLAGMDKNKLDMLQSLAEQGAGKSPNDLLPFLMTAMTQTRNSGMKFSQDEISVIIEVLKMGKSPEEVAKIDRMISLMRMMR